MAKRYHYRVETLPIGSLETSIRAITNTGYTGALAAVGGWRLVSVVLNAAVLPAANAICIFEREYDSSLGDITGTSYDDS